MVERDPIETLAGISDAREHPDPQFAARLLDDLLTDLVSEAIDEVGDAPAVELRAIDPLDTADVSAMDLLTNSNERTENVNRKRVVGGALAIAAAIVLIVGGILLTDGDDEVETAQAAGTRTAPPPTSGEPVFGSAEALSVVDAYFAANSAGDFAALRALFVADPAFTGEFGIAEDEQLFAWNAVQGTTVSPPECTAVNGAVEGTMTVTCQAFNQEVITQAVDGPPVRIRLTLTITPDGIVEENGFAQLNDFGTVDDPFDSWMEANHPDDHEAIGFGNWTTIEEAEQNGTLRAQYAAEWAAYLQANGCAYNDGC